MKKIKIIFKPAKKTVVWFRKTRRRNKAAVIVAVLLLLFFVTKQIQSHNQEPQYVMQPVERGTIVQVVTETGNVNTAGRVDIPSTTTGVIEEIYVDNNDQVALGQALFKVRSTATDQEIATAYANYQNALNALKTAEQNKLALDAQMWQAHQALLNARNVVNYKNDNTTNPSTREDYTELEKESIDAGLVQAEKSYQALEKKVLEGDTTISAAQSQVNSTWLAYAATQNVVVTAPAGGTVTNLSVQLGDKVTAGSMGGAPLTAAAAAPAKPVLTIANLQNYSVELSLNEVDIPKVKQGQKAHISLDAIPDKDFKGLVTHVDAVGMNNAGIVTFNVLVTIDNPDARIRPGMTANVEIEVDKAEKVLTVPNSAIKPYKGKKAVQVLNKKTKEPDYVPVEVGIKSTERTEIKSGISEGTQVVTATKNGMGTKTSGGPFGR